MKKFIVINKEKKVFTFMENYAGAFALDRLRFEISRYDIRGLEIIWIKPCDIFKVMRNGEFILALMDEEAALRCGLKGDYPRIKKITKFLKQK